MRLSAGPKLGVVFFCHLALSFDSSADHNKNYNIDTPQLYYMFLYNIQIFGDLWYKDVRTKIGPKNAFIGGFEVEPPSAKLGRWVIPATVGKCDPFFFLIHLGYHFNFTVVYLCQIIGGISPPSGGIVGKTGVPGVKPLSGIF